MASSVKVSVSGITDLQKRIENIAGGRMQKVLRGSVREVAEITRQRIISHLNERRDTGAMSRGITISVMEYDGKTMCFIRSPVREVLAKNNPKFDPKSKWYYPAHQEFGTKYIKPLNAYKRGAEETAKLGADVIRLGVSAAIAVGAR